jgi:SAM-dependent methyltransferase
MEAFVQNHLTAWDKDYASRGRLWGGAVKGLPDLAQGLTILELGCGDGKTLSALPGGGRMVALDISPRALQLAHHLRPDACFILADAACLPLHDEHFDAVFAFHVTGHLLAAERRALAQEAARVLADGGSLYFRDFGAEDMRAGQGEEVEPGTFRRGGGILTHYFTEEEVMGIFCELEPASIGTQSWTMRINGKDLKRAEVEAVFKKR